MKRETPLSSTPKKTPKAKVIPAKQPATNVVPMPPANTRPRAASSRTKTKPAPAPDASALRAYQLFEARHCEHGHDVDDWLQAEAELSAAKPSRRKATA